MATEGGSRRKHFFVFSHVAFFATVAVAFSGCKGVVKVTKKNYELAFEEYCKGLKYKEIAEKFKVSINTVKSWHRRYDWALKITEIKQDADQNNNEMHTNSSQNEIYKRTQKNIEASLRKQAKEIGLIQAHYSDLINDYMSLWDVKNRLIEDIKQRGVSVQGMHGKKKNDSVSELNKTNAQMLKLLNELGLDAAKVTKIEDGNDGDDV